jgi:16S rRNA (adenine1518-N6/adenine1519-N6)-dimethyltransferase
MKLSEMRQVLEARGIQLTKSLGQNFLHDHNQLRRIVDAAELTRSDQVLEIGPGLGPLTELLLEQAEHVLAIEKDARLVEVLRARLADNANLDLMHADALDVVRDRARDWSKFKLVANLPYSVASPILVELAQNPNRPQRMVATLQREVVDRIAAVPDSDDYGVLTLLLQLRYRVAGWFKVPRACFFPEPEVDSACVTLVRRDQPLLDENLHAPFERVVKRAFSQRRKVMAKLLKAEWPIEKVASAISALNVPADVRGEKLSLEQFVTLTRALVAGSTRPNAG